MNPILKNILAFVAAYVVGSIVNMCVVLLSLQLIKLPSSVDFNDFETVQSNIHLFEIQHFIGPFLAHALGTLMGAYVVSKLALNNQRYLALLIGMCFLLGGISMVMQLNSPMWFNVLDLGVAYIPMAYLGWLLAGSPK